MQSPLPPMQLTLTRCYARCSRFTPDNLPDAMKYSYFYNGVVGKIIIPSAKVLNHRANHRRTSESIGHTIGLSLKPSGYFATPSAEHPTPSATQRDTVGAESDTVGRQHRHRRRRQCHHRGQRWSPLNVSGFGTSSLDLTLNTVKTKENQGKSKHKLKLT